MFALMVLGSMMIEEPERTPSIYRCSASEAESKFFGPLVDEYGFDTFCVEPKPGPLATAAARGKVKFVSASVIDTKQNLSWRNATIDFVNGKISPQQWLSKTKSLGETVHFLSSPKSVGLRSATGEVSSTAVFAEMLLLSWPGKPCLTGDDLGKTRYLPGPGRLESWILAMNDYLGPMLYSRHSFPYWVTGKPKIVRADAKPGLLVFSQTDGKQTKTFILNNSKATMDLPSINLDFVTTNQGLDLEQSKPRLMSHGFLIVNSVKD